MKVLIVNTVPTERNGITGVIFNYLMAIDKGDVQMDLVSINEPIISFRKEVEERNGNIYVIPRNGRHLLTYWSGLRMLIKKNHYDILHVHGNSHTVVLELSAARAAHCVSGIVHAHTTTCRHIVLHRFLTPLFNILCKYRLACGEAAGRFMFGNKPFTVINNGVNTERFGFDVIKRERIRHIHNLNGCKVLGHVGYFAEVKNQKFVVDVLKELLNKDETYRLVLIGDGPLKTDVEFQTLRLGIRDKVVFAGSIDNVDEYLNAIDLIVMPSLFEGLPLTLIEQQVNGLECLVSDTITKEVNKTGNVSFLPLSDGACKWADWILKRNLFEGRKMRSESACEAVAQCGYSVADEARTLYNYYSEILTTAKL